MFVIFFFQAEDGIRGFCLSRGLGDVYKRQVQSAGLLDSGQAQNPRRERNPLSVDGADLSTNVPILRMNGEKYLIVNADDFGQSPGINRGIIEAHEHGIVTSTSLMTRWSAAGEAAAYAREHPTLSVGLHLDLGEWVYRDTGWVQLYTVIALDDRDAIQSEISRQLETFHALLGKLPDHINSHQHVHMLSLIH